MMDKLKGISQDRLKVHFARPEGAISRRDLLKLAIPRYEVVPFIEPDLCAGKEACGLCLGAVCPREAVKVEADEVTVDTTLCSGCGACVDTCPHRAIVYPSFTFEELDRNMEGSLLADGTGIIALTCRNCRLVSDGDGKTQPYSQTGICSLQIPCLAMASPLLMLRAFDRGARGLVLVSGRDKCQSGLDSSNWQGSVGFVRELLGCWGIEPERVGVFNITGNDAAGELDRFIGDIAGLAPTPFCGTQPALMPASGLMLPSLIKDMAGKVGAPSAGVVMDGLVPFGKLELDGSRCTGCGLCAVDCPTGALTAVLTDKGSYHLLFRHDSCIACDRCREVCPEQCLRLERVLELSSINNAAKVLFEDEVARCRECGSVIGPGAMVKELKVRLSGMGDSVVSQLELCTACKKRQVNLSIPVPGAATR